MATVTRQTTTLPPAMESIVEEVQLKNPNYLTLNRPYSKIGSNGVLVVEPGVVHFGGFEPGKTFKQTVRVVNASPVSRRIHVITPSTPFFKALCENKRGMLAPGLSEDITIEFTPEQWRYYYDTVRIHCEPENLLIPLHAYPIMNETKFPSRLDFGKCPVGDSVTKRVTMECKVPIEFEFNIRQLRSNPCFRVSPVQGVVPAHGHVSIEVSFSPTLLRTEEMQLEVTVAEFNSKPVLCTVTGSSLPGLTMERMIRGAAGGGADMAALDGTAALKEAALRWPPNKGGGSLRGGAGGGDAFTVSKQLARMGASSRDCRQTGPSTMRLPTGPLPPGEVELGGVYFPAGTLTSQSDMSYVLNQQPGKLRIKDIKHAITGKKQELQQQQEELGAIMGQDDEGDGGCGIHPLERPEVSAHIKAVLFKQLLQQAVEAEKRVVLGSGISIGEEVMSEQQIREVQSKREDQYRQHQLHIELEAMQRLTPGLQAKGAMHLHTAAPSSSPPSSSLPSSSPPQPVPGPVFVPEWRLLEANDWKKRSLALQRFTQAVHRVVYKQRMARRLAKMQDFLAQVGYDKERVAEESANPVLLVSESDRPGTAPAKHLKPEMVRTRPLPLFRDVNFVYRGPVEMGHYTDFDELGPMASKVPLEYLVLGYEPEDYPGLTPYAPPLLEQPLMDGAAEEQPDTTPSAVIQPLERLPAMPDSCQQMPFVTLEIGNRYSEDKVCAATQPSWGMSSSAAIQPRLYPIHESSAQDNVASVSVRSLRGVPLLVERWLPRREVWQLQLTEEMVPALMSAADPADLLVERPDDAGKPEISIRVPTAEEVARYLPPASDVPGGAGFTAGPSSGGERKESAPAPAPAPAGKPPGTPPGGKPPGTPPGGKKATAGAAAPPPPPPPVEDPAAAERAEAEAALVAEAARRRGKQPYELMRQRRQDELDAAKRYAHETKIKVLDRRLEEYNKMLNKPCYFAQKL